MDVKTVIKNDLWRWNYILPFLAKYRAEEGKFTLLKHICQLYRQIHPVRGNGIKRTVGNDVKAMLEKIDIELRPDSRFVYFLDINKTIAVQGNILGNFTLDYGKIIHGTFKELAEKANGNDLYGKSAMQVTAGICKLTERIIEKLNESDFPEDLKRDRIKDFERMLTEPAIHFEEALQRILFFNQILWQTRHRLNGLGRLDLLLGDLYQKDVEEIGLTPECAIQIVEDFLLELSRYPEYKSDALQGDIGQIIVLGGLKEDGSYFCNDLTELFLKAQSDLRRPDPKIFLRVSEKMPEGLLRIATRSLLSGNGSPLFSNDDVVVPALLDFGMSKKDAFSYAVSACWEPFIIGKSMDQNNIASFDYFKALDETLNKEKNYGSFSEFLEEYDRCNRRNFQNFLGSLNQIKWARDPFVSVFTEGCSEKRKDISQGAAQYNNYGITTVGLSNVIDSLMNIKELVYDSHKISLKELNRIRNNDYVDSDDLYRNIKSKKYYGHDMEETIHLVNRVTKGMSEIASQYRNCFGGTVKFGLSSPGYVLRGKSTQADVSGRKAGMPYNTHISCLDAPYTEVVKFASALDYGKQRFNGNVVDFFVTPDFIQQNFDKFVLFMKGAIRSGFFQMQMNVMDSRTLIDAKEHPEKYAGLIVRVWGFSAYFNDLPENYKDVLIERAVSAERVS